MRLSNFEMFSITRDLQFFMVSILTYSGIDKVGSISARADTHLIARPGLRFSLIYFLISGSSLGISA
jgi:predicted AlkP superfamily pyrophosphatase or phosphodiesterase